MKSRREFLKIIGLSGAGLLIPWGRAGRVFGYTLSDGALRINPNKLDKYADKLPIPGVYKPKVIEENGIKIDYYEIKVQECRQWLHKYFETEGESYKANLWGYGPLGGQVSSPAATIEARKGRPVRVRLINKLDPTVSHPLEKALDKTLTGAEDPVIHRTVTHLHGAEVPSDSDGWMMKSFNPGEEFVYNYPNLQEGATLWYHDHAMGITRLNTLAGLAGFYLLRDPKYEDEFLAGGVIKNPDFLNLPRNIGGKVYEIPLAIQDRLLTEKGLIDYPFEEVGQTEHPNWAPEYFGNIILVNGKAWPYLEVEARKYRFRVLNGSNSRVYNLKLSENLPIYLIGTDGGFIPQPVKIESLILMPGERADLIVDFTGVTPGTKILLNNDANAPFPDGDATDEHTSQIMQFRVIPQDLLFPDTSSIPAAIAGLRAFIPYDPKTSNYKKRTFTLNELEVNGTPVMAVVNNRAFMDCLSEDESPEFGATEIWEFVNMTMDAHPIHLHCVQFNLLNRQAFNSDEMTGYPAEFYKNGQNGLELENGLHRPTRKPVSVPIEPYLTGEPILPKPEERCWKDTIIMYPGEVTRILVDFSVRFKPTSPDGYERYVYHCHILDHEDNEMVRPLVIRVPGTKFDDMAHMKGNYTSVASGGTMPASAMLMQNYPNPFNPSTEISFRLDRVEDVELKVYSINGQEVCTLIEGGTYQAGEHKVKWNGKTGHGASAASGTYICRLKTSSFSQSIKMNLIR